MTRNNLGVLAFGDSITNGGGELQWGVALQSWALWVARALGLPYTGYAVDGATVADVLDGPDPGVRADQRACRRRRYDLGCLYIGANNVGSPEWNASLFERDFRVVLGYAERALRPHADASPFRSTSGARASAQRWRS